MLATTIQEGMDRLLKAHREELFVSKASRPDASPRPPETPPSHPEDLSEEESAFNSLFPPLPPSDDDLPLSTLSNPFHDPTPPGTPPAQPTNFDALVASTTSLLVWRLKRMVESKIEEGEAAWRQEKARAQGEYDRLEEEVCREIEKREAAEEDLLATKARVVVAESAMKRAEFGLEKVTLRIAAEQLSYHEDLEGAARAAQALQERNEVLQSLVNDLSSNPPRPEADDTDNAWGELVNEQSEALSQHAQGLQKISSQVVCPICSSTMDGATAMGMGEEEA
ncbi:hypothetical protein RQP46_000368 [Phenoliferia psychrophenolica]